MLTPIEIKTRAAEETFKKFEGKTLQLGKYDCARMVAYHLKKCGHKLSVLSAGYYSTEVGARLALKRLGVTSPADLMDQNFKRIPFAMATIGDVACVRGEGDLGESMQILLHRQHVLGLKDGIFAELVVLEPLYAWRVL